MVTAVDIACFIKQDDFVQCQARYSAMIGGRGSGKTESGAIKLLQHTIETPGLLYIVTAPTYKMLSDATLRTVQKVFPPILIADFLSGDMKMILANGSEILFRTTDNPDALRGPNIGGFWMDEAALGTITNPDSQYDAFLVLQGTLRQGSNPQGWITTTPKGFNWVYREFAQKTRPEYWWVQASSRDNPFLTTEFINSLEESYEHDYGLQEIEGQFVITGGNAYFKAESIKALLDYCREPATREGGLISIWKRPVATGQYIAFGDVAWGETGAYSCIVIADWRTMEQVAEIYGRPTLDELTRAIYDTCKAYNNAYLGIEANGEGQTIVNNLVDMRYPNMYHHGEKWRNITGQRGWLTTGGAMGSRDLMLTDLRQVVDEVQIVPRCRDAVNEMGTFHRDERGHPGPIAGTYSDHVMAWAGLVQMKRHARFPGVSRQPLSVALYT